MGATSNLEVPSEIGSDEGEALVKSLARMIEEKRLKVRVYTRGRLHAKAYIFDYKADGRYEKGIAVVGSSNLTLSGVTHNTELNVVIVAAFLAVTDTDDPAALWRLALMTGMRRGEVLGLKWEVGLMRQTN